MPIRAAQPYPSCPRNPLPRDPAPTRKHGPHPLTPLHPPVSHRSSSEAGCSAAASEARHWMARLRTPARLSSSSGSSACSGCVNRGQQSNGALVRCGTNCRGLLCLVCGTTQQSIQQALHHARQARASACRRASQLKRAPNRPHSPMPAPPAHLLQPFGVGQQGAVAGSQLRQDVQASSHHIRLLWGAGGKGWLQTGGVAGSRCRGKSRHGGCLPDSQQNGHTLQAGRLVAFTGCLDEAKQPLSAVYQPTTASFPHLRLEAQDELGGGGGHQRARLLGAQLCNRAGGKA